MAAVVHHASEVPEVREYASRAVQGATLPLHRAQAVFHELKRSVKFRRDPDGLELLRHPEQLVLEIQRQGFAYGDCDDRAMLGAAMLRAVGIKPAFIVMAVTEGGPFEHVYFAARIGDALLPLDPQETPQPFTQRKATRRKVYDL